ncbi:MAG TPA: efflux RND transporter periplasmic adaptor subunit [Polyangiaceae bacterium]|nr:efflux RND transporter periplasmic adaptor subunit [Polyangiaceae bacterium]
MAAFTSVPGAAITIAQLTGGCSGGHTVSAEPPSRAGEVWLTSKQAEEAHLKTEPVGFRRVDNALLAAGRVAFDDLHVAHVFSPVTGRVRQISARLGERVKKGRALAVIESPDVGIAVSDLQKAEADFVAATHNFQRQNELYAMHAVSERDFEAASDDFGRARAELERSRKKSSLLRVGASSVGQSFVLNSPIDGEVIDRAVNPGIEVQGEYSGSGPAVELFTVGELDPIWVLADVYEMDVPRIKVGSEVTVSVVAYPDKRFDGKIDWVSSTLDVTTRTSRVRCTLRNSERLLRPGMYATVSIQTDGRSALAVPRPAILHVGDHTAVFLSIGKRADGALGFAQRVITPEEDVPGDVVPIASGLNPGDTVVTSGGILLTNQ